MNKIVNVEQLVSHIEQSWQVYVCTAIRPALLIYHPVDGWVWCPLRLPADETMDYGARYTEAVRQVVEFFNTDAVALVENDPPGTLGGELFLTVLRRESSTPEVISWLIAGDKLIARRTPTAAEAPKYPNVFEPPRHVLRAPPEADVTHLFRGADTEYRAALEALKLAWLHACADEQRPK